jgi:spore coat protein CotH
MHQAAVKLIRTGLPSARNTFAAVYWDVGDGPVYRGLYTMMEDPSDQLMDRVWGDDSGNLYKPEGDCADWTCFEEESFEKKTNEDAADWSDIIAVLDDLNDAGLEGEAFRSALEAGFDVDGFLRWLAVNTAMVNWDQYGTMAQNHYVYGVPEDGGRLTWIPWDYSLSLMSTGPTGEALDTDDVFHDAVGDEWPLIRRLLDEEVYRARYEEHLADALVGAMEVETFRAQAETLHALISPYVIGEDGEREESTMLSSEAAFEGSVDDLVEHVESRHELVTEALAE